MPLIAESFIADASFQMLASSTISLPPGGNDVRSYLDVIAPDETPTQEIRNAVVPFVDRARGRTLPWTETIGRCTFRFGVEQGLHASWPEEFRRLLLSAFPFAERPDYAVARSTTASRVRTLSRNGCG
jgi:hypothetical protein